MSGKMSRDAYEKLVAEDLAELMKLPRSLERAHIELILRQSPAREYDDAAAIASLRAEVERLKAPRLFPLQCDRTGSGPARIPWAIAEEAYGAYVRRYGRGQSLERIAARGGFGWSEMDELLPGWRSMVSEVERLTKELDEAIAARETFQWTTTQETIQKAKALDALEAWLLAGGERVRIVQLSFGFAVELAKGETVCGAATNGLAAAITAALAKAATEKERRG